MAAHRGHPKAGGRKANTPNKFSVERAERAAKEGNLPHEGMLKLGRILEGMAARYQPRTTTPDGQVVENPRHNEGKYLDLIMRAATVFKWCAPYYAPHLTAMKVDYRDVTPQDLTDAELAALEPIAKRLARAGNGSMGDTTTRH